MFEGGRLSGEEEQQEFENKRPGEGSQFEQALKPQRREGEGESEEQDMDEVWGKDRDFEEEPKRQPVEDHYEYYEGDSDEGNDADFKTKYQLFESDERVTTTYPDPEEEAKSCLLIPKCNKYRHASHFRGTRLFELFKVQIVKNDSSSDGSDGGSSHGSSSTLEGRLWGKIEFATPQHLDVVPFYENSITLKLEPGKIVNLPLSGPTASCPPCTDMSERLSLGFDMKFEEEELDDTLCLSAENMSWDRNMDYSPLIQRIILGKPSCLGKGPLVMAASFASYCGALATVSVEILKKGVTSCSGFVFARSCIFLSRFRLLSLEKDEARELEGSSVKLTRSVVAIPSYSSLIITAVLYDQSGKEIGRDRTAFRASRKGTYSNLIGNGSIRIGVNWKTDYADLDLETNGYYYIF